jgi:hypothetical protein
MSERELPMWDRTKVAAHLGVTPKAVSQFLTDSKDGARYEHNKFPEPDGYIGRGPWWYKERADEFTAWMQSRPGRGKGGGRPAHKSRIAPAN